MSLQSMVNKVNDNMKNILNNSTENKFSPVNICPPNAISDTSYSTESCICSKFSNNTQIIAKGGPYGYTGYINQGTPNQTKIWYCSTVKY